MRQVTSAGPVRSACYASIPQGTRKRREEVRMLAADLAKEARCCAVRL
ncbi:hypothetical protein ACFY2M_45150 [Streptomyces sp. NPDC001276]